MAITSADCRQARLDTIPLEILELIARQFCTHCNGYDSWDDRIPHDILTDPHQQTTKLEETLLRLDQANSRALLAMCRTSRRLREVAQPVRYHRISPLPLHCRNLIVTLASRPDLASSVKCLGRFQSDQDSPDFAWDAGLASHERQKVVAVIGRDPDRFYDEPFNFDHIEVNTILLLLLCRRVESLHQRLYYTLTEETEEIDPVEIKVPKAAPWIALPGIRSLTLDCTDMEGFSADHSHANMLMMSVPNITQLSIRKFNLETLTETDTLSDWFDMHHGHLPIKKLQLLSCVGRRGSFQEAYVFKLISCASGLESFIYHADSYVGASHVHMPPVVRALQKHKDSLRSVHLDLCDVSDWFTGFELPSPLDMGCFSALTTLVLDEKCFCTHYGVGTGNDGKPPVCITEMLPPSLIALEITIFTHSNLLGDLEALGSQAHRFPALQTVVLQPVIRYRLDIDHGWSSRNFRVDWEPFHTLFDLFRATHVAFELREQFYRF